MNLISIVCEDMVDQYKEEALNMLCLLENISDNNDNEIAYNDKMKELLEDLRDIICRNNTLMLRTEQLSEIENDEERLDEMKEIFRTKCITKVSYEVLLLTLFLLKGDITKDTFINRVDNIMSKEMRFKIIAGEQKLHE